MSSSLNSFVPSAGDVTVDRNPKGDQPDQTQIMDGRQAGDSEDPSAESVRRKKVAPMRPDDSGQAREEGSADDMDLDETIDSHIGVRMEAERRQMHSLPSDEEEDEEEDDVMGIDPVNILDSLPLEGAPIEGQEVSEADLLGKMDDDDDDDDLEVKSSQSGEDDNPEGGKREHEADPDTSKKKQKKDEGTEGPSEEEKRNDKKTANMRRNIREVMDETQLDEVTLAAQRQEMERLRRVQEQQRIIREVRLPNSVMLSKISPGTAGSQAVPGQQGVAPRRPMAESSRWQRGTRDGLQTSTSRAPTQSNTLQQRIRMMTPSVTISPVVSKSSSKDQIEHLEYYTDSDLSDVDPESDELMSHEKQVQQACKLSGVPKPGHTKPPKGKDVVTISSSSESSDDDCIVLSDPSEAEETDNDDDPSNSGIHTNDRYNIPDEHGRVLVNVGHPDNEPDVFLAPQVARVIKPHQIGGIRFLYDNIVESIDRFKTSSGFGCILAHSMGLGKTMQVASFCDIFFRCTDAKTVLCIMPINTLQNWLAEFNMWLPYEDPNKAKIEEKTAIKEESNQSESNFSYLSRSGSEHEHLNSLQKHQQPLASTVPGNNPYAPQHNYSQNQVPHYGQNSGGMYDPRYGPTYPAAPGYTPIKTEPSCHSQPLNPYGGMPQYNTGYPPNMQGMQPSEYPSMDPNMHPGMHGINSQMTPSIYPGYGANPNAPYPNYGNQLRPDASDMKKEDIKMPEQVTAPNQVCIKTEPKDESKKEAELPGKESSDAKKDETLIKTPFTVDAPADVDIRPRHFNLHILNDSHKTMAARARVIREWQKIGGVLLIGYELYRQLSLKKPAKAKRKRGQPFKDPSADVEEEDKNKPLLDEMHSALVSPGPDLVICDEGHRIKNSHASISMALKQMRTKRRIVLTGYPLQNNLLEYWCMVDFVRPNYLGTKSEFCNMFERPIQNGQCIDSTPQDIRLMRYRAHVLHALLEGFVQRRSHTVLQLSLPRKEEFIMLIRMTPFQRKLYKFFMEEVVKKRAVPNALKAFAVCCKIWNHPDILYHFLKKRQANEEDDLDLEETIVDKTAPGGTKRVPKPRTPKGEGKRGRKANPKNKPAASVQPNLSNASGENRENDTQKQPQDFQSFNTPAPPPLPNNAGFSSAGQQNTYQQQQHQQSGQYQNYHGGEFYGNQNQQPQQYPTSSQHFSQYTQNPNYSSNNQTQPQQQQQSQQSQYPVQPNFNVSSNDPAATNVHGQRYPGPSPTGSNSKNTPNFQPSQDQTMRTSGGIQQQNYPYQDRDKNFSGSNVNQGTNYTQQIPSQQSSNFQSQNHAPNQAPISDYNSYSTQNPNQQGYSNPVGQSMQGTGINYPNGSQQQQQQQQVGPGNNANISAPGYLGNQQQSGSNAPGFSQSQQTSSSSIQNSTMQNQSFPINQAGTQNPMGFNASQQQSNQQQHGFQQNVSTNQMRSYQQNTPQNQTPNYTQTQISSNQPSQMSSYTGVQNQQPQPQPQQQPPQHQGSHQQPPLHQGSHQQQLEQQQQYQQQQFPQSQQLPQQQMQHVQHQHFEQHSSHQQFQQPPPPPPPQQQQQQPPPPPQQQQQQQQQSQQQQQPQHQQQQQPQPQHQHGYNQQSAGYQSTNHQSQQVSNQMGYSSNQTGSTTPSQVPLGYPPNAPQNQTNSGAQNVNYPSNTQTQNIKTEPGYPLSDPQSAQAVVSNYPVTNTPQDFSSANPQMSSTNTMSDSQHSQPSMQGQNQYWQRNYQSSNDPYFSNSNSNQYQSNYSSNSQGSSGNYQSNQQKLQNTQNQQDQPNQQNQQNQYTNFSINNMTESKSSQRMGTVEGMQNPVAQNNPGTVQGSQNQAPFYSGSINMASNMPVQSNTGSKDLLEGPNKEDGDKSKILEKDKDKDSKSDEELFKDESEKEKFLAAMANIKEDTGIPYDWATELMKEYVPGLIDASAKMTLFFCILEESIRLGDRILTFSQSLFTLNLIEVFLARNDFKDKDGKTESWAKNVNYYRLDGSTSALEREKLINEFNANPKVHLFLVSTRAGSLGINLVGANRAIVFDASWNPCHDTQAVCRVYRYGQKKSCFVYRLVADNCLEKKIYDRQISKQGMSDRVVDQCNPDAHLSLKEATTLSWDWEEDSQVEDFSESKEGYTDKILHILLEKHSALLTKKPFHHESLLVDRKDKKLSQAEKRLARRGYELEKMAANCSRPSYNYVPGNTAPRVSVSSGSLQIRQIRGESGPTSKPVASVRPMQQRGTDGLNARNPTGSRWIPAEVWQRQGMSAQEMTLPLDVVIPTNSPDKGSIVLKAGQRVMVLKSPKGIYMQLESGKIIAIRTALKINQQKKDEEQPKKSVPPPQRNPVKSDISFPLRNNSAISIIPKSSASNTQQNRSIVKTGVNYRPFGEKEVVNRRKPVATATAKPYSSQINSNQVTLSRVSKTKLNSHPVSDASSVGENSNSSDGQKMQSDQRVEEVRIEDMVNDSNSDYSPSSSRPSNSDTDSNLQRPLQELRVAPHFSLKNSPQMRPQLMRPQPAQDRDSYMHNDSKLSMQKKFEPSRTGFQNEKKADMGDELVLDESIQHRHHQHTQAQLPLQPYPLAHQPPQQQPQKNQRLTRDQRLAEHRPQPRPAPRVTSDINVSSGKKSNQPSPSSSTNPSPAPTPPSRSAKATPPIEQATPLLARPNETSLPVGDPAHGYPYVQYPRYYGDYSDPRPRSDLYANYPPAALPPRIAPESTPTKPVQPKTNSTVSESTEPTPQAAKSVEVAAPAAVSTNTSQQPPKEDTHAPTAFSHPTRPAYPPGPYPPAPYDPYAQHYPPAPASSAAYPPTAPGYPAYGGPSYNADYARMYSAFHGPPPPAADPYRGYAPPPPPGSHPSNYYPPFPHPPPPYPNYSFLPPYPNPNVPAEPQPPAQ